MSLFSKDLAKVSKRTPTAKNKFVIFHLITDIS